MTLNLMNRKQVLNDNPFAKAVRKRSYIKAALVGMPGAGKTYTALLLATQLGERVAFVDSEVGSASLYAKEFDFDTVDFAPPYHPDALVNAILAAEAHGYDVIVIDSLSHVWSGPGGMIDIADSVKSSNKFAGWNKVKPIQQALIDTILNAKLHIICTVRGKPKSTDKWVDTDFDTLGMMPDLRDEMLFEFDFVGAMGRAHDLYVAKTRMSHMRNVPRVVPRNLSAKHGSTPTYPMLVDILKNWANEGADPDLYFWEDRDGVAIFVKDMALRYASPDESEADFAKRALTLLDPKALRYGDLAGKLTRAEAAVRLADAMPVVESGPGLDVVEAEGNDAQPSLMDVPEPDNVTAFTG